MYTNHTARTYNDFNSSLLHRIIIGDSKYSWRIDNKNNLPKFQIFFDNKKLFEENILVDNISPNLIKRKINKYIDSIL